MSKTTTNQALVAKIAAALRANERAKTDRQPDDNPFHDHDLTAMRGAGLLKAQDKHPAVNMATRGEPLGYDMEAARFAELSAHKADKSAKRMAQARARAARKVALDEIVAKPVKPEPGRMAQAWEIVVFLVPIIYKAARAKQVWAARYLGNVTDDVAGAVLENMALLLAKSDQDLDVLTESAKQLAEVTKRKNLMPGDQRTDLDKAVGKGRKWLMQVLNNRVMGTLVDTYFRAANAKDVNVDLIATVMANINGPGEDPLHANFKASRAPAFMGTRYASPGNVDPALLAQVIASGITERRLDALAEVLLTEEHLRTDGSFKWSKHAEQVFMAEPYGNGPWLWEQVCRSTEGTDRARKARGDAARKYVRSEFAWLPGFITAAVESFDPQRVMHLSEGEAMPERLFRTTVCECCERDAQHVLAPEPGRASLPNLPGRMWPTVPVYNVPVGTCSGVLIASDFELFHLPDEPERREPLVPVLKFASTEEAARVLVEHMNQVVTNEDLLEGLVSA